VTPQEALVAALSKTIDREAMGAAVIGGGKEWYAAALLAALPEGWRLTNEPEVTVERLARVLRTWFGPLHPDGATFPTDAEVRALFLIDAEAIIRALRGAP